MGTDKGREKSEMNRRDFIKLSAAGAAMAGTAGACSRQEEEVSAAQASQQIPRRKLGQTNMNASLLGMGGGSALTIIKDDQEALAMIEHARSRGVNYFDTGTEYGGGSSEKRFGEALAPYRKEIYLSTKFMPNETPDEIRSKFERSLERFRTDYIDNANLHAFASLEDVEAMYSSGSLETLIKLRQEGVLRYIGLTSHNSPPAVTEALKRFNFDVALMAANASRVPFWGEFEENNMSSFEDEAIPLAVEQKVGLWGFKVTGQRRLIAKKGQEQHKAPVNDLIRYSLSLPVHGIILGMSSIEQVDNACEMVSNYSPLSAEQMKAMNENLAPSANELTYLDPSYVDDGGWRDHMVV